VSRVAEILLQQGRIAGEAARAKRDIWGQAISNISQIPAQIGHQRQQREVLDLQRQREQRLTQAAQAEAETRMLALDEQRKQAIAGSAAKLLAINPNPSDEDAQRWYQGVRNTFRPDEQGLLDQLLKQPGGGKQVLTYIAPLAKPGEGFTLGEGQVRYGPAGQELARGPAKAVRPVAPTEASLAQAAASGDETAAKALQLLQTQNREKSPTNIDLAMRAVNGDVKAADALKLLKPSGAGEPLVPVIGPDGQPVLLPRSEAAGKRPAGSGVAGGRPLPAGSASRIAEVNDSLNDASVLKRALSEAGATGTVAKLGAWAPNWVTEVTGFGTDAKKKQALIDRVKQVIGKGLEEGVLRKEDEAKYEKILPTISDPPEIVTSKIEGLEAALATKRQNRLESFADAGYDVSRFERRDTAASPKTAPSRLDAEWEKLPKPPPDAPRGALTPEQSRFLVAHPEYVGQWPPQPNERPNPKAAPTKNPFR
jgi:hypothetical protein